MTASGEEREVESAAAPAAAESCWHRTQLGEHWMECSNLVEKGKEKAEAHAVTNDSDSFPYPEL